MAETKEGGPVKVSVWKRIDMWMLRAVQKATRIFTICLVLTAAGIVALVVYRDEVESGVTESCSYVISEKMKSGVCRIGEQGLDCSGTPRSVFGHGGNLSDPN